MKLWYKNHIWYFRSEKFSAMLVYEKAFAYPVKLLWINYSLSRRIGKHGSKAWWKFKLIW